MAESKQSDTEALLQLLDQRIEKLKIKYNLYFAGEEHIPPEKERENIEKQIRDLLTGSNKSPRITLLIQNVASKFTLFNNMWLKRLHKIEIGEEIIPRRASSSPTAPTGGEPMSLTVSLNDEASFDKFYSHYARMSRHKKMDDQKKEQVINTLKSKMITRNVIDASVDLQVEKGKLKLVIKSPE